MNIIFLTLNNIENIDGVGIYTDLLRYLNKSKANNIFVVRPLERRDGGQTQLLDKEGVKILKVKTLNITKCSAIEKGLSTLSIERLFINSIKKYFADVRFDLVLYSTPPITFSGVVSFLKRRDGAKSFLLLKDIFPQNAIDLNMISKDSILHKWFRKKERALYSVSDHIGCMSPANCDYLLRHNPEISIEKVSLSPNCIDINLVPLVSANKSKLRNRWSLPDNAIIFIYGGNLGKPQGVDNLIWVIDRYKNREDIYFVIAGSGTHYDIIKKSIDGINNARLYSFLPRQEYNDLVQCADIGMIFLSQYFEIPNFPSRLTAYLSVGLPIFCVTDRATDIGRIAEKNGFGYSIELDKSPILDQYEVQKKVVDSIDSIINKSIDLKVMGLKGYEYMKDNFSAEEQANQIISWTSKQTN